MIEPPCTTVQYRVNLAVGEIEVSESKSMRLELEDTMDLESIGHIIMERLDGGNKMELTWSVIPCIKTYSFKMCSDGEECEEGHIDGGSLDAARVRWERDVDPCREYTVTITPISE